MREDDSSVANYLEEVTSNVDGDEACTTTHAAEVHTLYVPPHLVVIDNHGRERRRGIKERTIHHENAHVLGFDPCLLEKFVEGAKHDLLGLVPCLPQARLALANRGIIDDGFWEVCAVTQP